MTTRGQPERVEGYEPFFGLNEAPFSLAPDPRFLFASASHSAALAQVAHALQRREPLVVITGEIGTGKTLLCRTVLQRLRRKTFLSVINDPLLERDDLLKQLLQDFGVISNDRTKLTEASRHELVDTLHAFLRSLASINAHAVVIIDEAQHLQPDVLEQIRLLSNVDDERGTLLQIILVGQTDLEPLLSRPELRQLQQRVSRRLPLKPLNTDEVEQYITHRLVLARDGRPPSQVPGATELERELAEWEGTKRGVEFTPDAIRAVSQLSGGVPRVINLLCDRSLEEAHASRLRIVDSRLIHVAARVLGVAEQAAPAAQASLSVTARSAQIGSDRSFWPVAESESKRENELAHGADEAAPVESLKSVENLGPVERPGWFSAHTRPAATPRLATYLVLATSLALVAAAIVFVVRPARPPSVQGPSPAEASSSTRGSSAQPDTTPAAANTLPPKPEATTGTPTAPAAAPAPATVAATAGDGQFEIVVASFRTDARATSVAADVAALGLPIRRRVSGGWQQVLSGPFASRTDAEEAQQRLNHAGLTGTQIAPTAR